MKKRILSVISAIAMLLMLIAFMPAEKAMASSSITIDDVSIIQPGVYAGSPYAVATVKVWVSVDYPYNVSKIDVVLEDYYGVHDTLSGSVGSGFNGSGVYNVDIAVPSDAHGTYIVKSVKAYATDGSSDYRDDVDSFDSMWVANRTPHTLPSFITSIDTKWIKKSGENVLEFRVGGYGSTGINKVSSIIAKFADKNGNTVRLSKFTAGAGGYYTSTIKESEIVGTDVYTITELLIKDTDGNESLYNFSDDTVTYNGLVSRTMSSRLSAVSFAAGDGAAKPAAVAPSKTTTTTTETKSPTTGQGNTGMAAVIIAALGVAVVGLLAIAAKKISSR